MVKTMGQKTFDKPLDHAKEQKELEERAKKLYGEGYDAIEWWQPRGEIENIDDIVDSVVLGPIFQKGKTINKKEKLEYLGKYPNILLGIKELYRLLRNQGQIPEPWQRKSPVRFYGTVIWNWMFGGFWTPLIHWSGTRWQLGQASFESDDGGALSAILEKPKENSGKKTKQPCQAA